MARGVTLAALLDQYRSACRVSRNAAHNVGSRDAQIQALQLKQEWLWGDFDWPHLRVDRYIDLQAGQRTYEPPADMKIDRVLTLHVRYGGTYIPLMPGIDDHHYATYDSELDERAWPAARWRIFEDEQIEVWPVPDQNYDATNGEGRIRVTGIRNLRPLVDDSDVTDLDAQLLVKTTAADYLASTGAKDANLKLQEADRLYTKLRGKMLPRRKFKMFNGTPEPSRRMVISSYRPPEV